MKKRVVILLLIILEVVACCLSGWNCWGWPEKQFTRKELENDLLGIELIYIKNYESRCNYDLIAELSDDDVKYVMERITQIHFVGYSPRSSESVYGIKFCYKDESLVFEPNNIVRIDNNGEKVKGTKWFCMAGPEELMNLIDELVDKYLEM